MAESVGVPVLNREDVEILVYFEEGEVNVVWTCGETYTFDSQQWDAIMEDLDLTTKSKHQMGVHLEEYVSDDFWAWQKSGTIYVSDELGYEQDAVKLDKQTLKRAVRTARQRAEKEAASA